MTVVYLLKYEAFQFSFPLINKKKKGYNIFQAIKVYPLLLALFLVLLNV